jgi:NADH dehydrogenase/NADH:ubiquinone oxidoreductase subunit G
MIKVKINGKIYEAEKGEYILEVCRQNSVLIPTLCHHDGISGLGACRLCVVEVNEGKGNAVVVSCVYPLNRDCEVFTESEKIKIIRKTILSMLKTRAQEGDRLASLCQIYGVNDEARFTVPSAEKTSLASACVLCGLSAHACANMGTGAISTVGRGVSKEISTPYGEPSSDCVGCGSCAAVCPTKAIECTESNGIRTIWGKEFKLLHCVSCGKAFATEEEFAWAQKKLNSTSEAAAVLCDACRRKKNADVFATAFWDRI